MLVCASGWKKKTLSRDHETHPHRVNFRPEIGHAEAFVHFWPPFRRRLEQRSKTLSISGSVPEVEKVRTDWRHSSDQNLVFERIVFVSRSRESLVVRSCGIEIGRISIKATYLLHCLITGIQLRLNKFKTHISWIWLKIRQGCCIVFCMAAVPCMPVAWLWHWLWLWQQSQSGIGLIVRCHPRLRVPLSLVHSVPDFGVLG